MSGKERFSSEERKRLATDELDADIDRFMDGLAANRSQSGNEKKPFNLDDWIADAERHPAFAQKLRADDANEYSAGIQALQALKYDEDDPMECVTALKEDGNRHFKHQNYCWAIAAYTKGIKLCCADDRLNSLLYSNRAAAHRRLGNVRSALRDCLFARRFDPTNLKAIYRGAECLLELGEATKCIEWTDSAPMIDEKLGQLRAKALSAKPLEEREARREKAKSRAEYKQKMALLEALRARCITLSPPIEDTDSLVQLAIPFGQIDRHIMVHLDECGTELVWPLLLQYPEHGQTDFIAECPENASLRDVLSEVFATPAQWDLQHGFRFGNIRLFIALDCPDNGDQIREIPLSITLSQVLGWPNLTVVRGLPVVQVYTKEYLKCHKLKVSSEVDRIFQFVEKQT